MSIIQSRAQSKDCQSSGYYQNQLNRAVIIIVIR